MAVIFKWMNSETFNTILDEQEKKGIISVNSHIIILEQRKTVSQRPNNMHKFFSYLTNEKKSTIVENVNSAGWSSLEARRAHNPKVVGSNPAPAIFSKPLMQISGFLYRITK